MPIVSWCFACDFINEICFVIRRSEVMSGWQTAHLWLRYIWEEWIHIFNPCWCCERYKRGKGISFNFCLKDNGFHCHACVLTSCFVRNVYKRYVKFEAFVVNKRTEILPGDQPHQSWTKNHRFEDIDPDGGVCRCSKRWFLFNLWRSWLPKRILVHL